MLSLRKEMLDSKLDLFIIKKLISLFYKNKNTSPCQHHHIHELCTFQCSMTCIYLSTPASLVPCISFLIPQLILNQTKSSSSSRSLHSAASTLMSTTEMAKSLMLFCTALAACLALAAADWSQGTATFYGGPDGSGTMGNYFRMHAFRYMMRQIS